MSYKNRRLKFPYQTKSDIVSEILIGSQPMNSLTETFQDARQANLFKPSLLTRRLEKVIAESSCEKTKERAQKAIDGLKTFKEIPIPEITRHLILKKVDEPVQENRKQGVN